MSENKEKKERRAARQARRNQLYARLCLQASVVCDSHRKREVERVDATTRRMLRTLLELLGDRPMTRLKKQMLAQHLANCGYVDEPTVELAEDDLLYVNGYFDVRDLAKRMAWSDEMVGETINV